MTFSNGLNSRMDGITADCRHAVRLYARTPIASLVAVIMLAVATAFVGTFLSLYSDLVLRPHPGFQQSGGIVTIGQNDGSLTTVISYPAAERMAAEMTSVEIVAMANFQRASLGTERAVTAVEWVSRDFFGGLRPRLALGRGFRAEDHAPDAEPVTVISHRLWRERYGADPHVLGATIEVARDPAAIALPGQSSASESDPGPVPFRIVGVMSDALPGLASRNAALWLPMESARPILDPNAERPASGRAYARLRSGVPAAALASEFNARFADEQVELGIRAGARLDAIEGVVDNIAVQRAARRQLQLFLGGSVLLALVAAANVSLFLIARAPGRRRELGVRMAVGASIKRLARQLVTEAGLLVIVAAALGLVASIWLATWIRNFSFLHGAQWRDVTLFDWRVLSLAAIFVLVLALLVSLAPVVGLKRFGIAASSQQSNARASLPQRIAGSVQIAVAGMLGGAAIAFAWYVGSMQFGDPGYETANRHLVGGVGVAPGLDRAGLLVELARRREVLEGIPGVSAVAFGRPVPGQRDSVQQTRVTDPNNSARHVETFLGTMEDRFIEVLGLRLIHGRAPDQSDTAGVVVNQAFARALWGHDDVVGEWLPGAVFWGPEGAQVLGVIEDLWFEHPSASVPPVVYATQDSPAAFPMAVVEARLTAAELQQALRALADAGELGFEPGDVHSLEGMRIDRIATDRARGFLTIASAALAAFLAAFGFYGTQHYLVAAGRREYAIRASLGAGPRALRRLVLWRGLQFGLPGTAAGGLLAFIIVAWLRDDLLSRDISPTLVSAQVVVVLLLLLLAAGLAPARMAQHTQPAPLLRED